MDVVRILQCIEETVAGHFGRTEIHIAESLSIAAQTVVEFAVGIHGAGKTGRPDQILGHVRVQEQVPQTDGHVVDGGVPEFCGERLDLFVIKTLDGPIVGQHHGITGSFGQLVRKAHFFGIRRDGNTGIKLHVDLVDVLFRIQLLIILCQFVNSQKRLVNVFASRIVRIQNFGKHG